MSKIWPFVTKFSPFWEFLSCIFKRWLHIFLSLTSLNFGSFWGTNHTVSCCFQFCSYFHLFSTKKQGFSSSTRRSLKKPMENFTVFSSSKFSWKIGKKFAQELHKRAFQKCGSRPSIVLSPSSRQKWNVKLIFGLSALAVEAYGFMHVCACVRACVRSWRHIY